MTATTRRLLFDLETDNLLDDVTTIWCLVARDIDTDDEFVYGPTEIDKGLDLLRSASLLAGHNIAQYDLPVLQKLKGYVRPKRGGILDTLLWSRASFPMLSIDDYKRSLRNPDNAIEPRLSGSHSLEAWGRRLGEHKGDIGKDFSKYTPEMLEYCRQDVALNVTLLRHLTVHGAVPEDAARLESEVGWILGRQQRHGVRFNAPAAVNLHAVLAQRQADLIASLDGLFEPWTVPAGVLVPKRDNKARGYVKGVPVHKTKTLTFNPTSHDHIASRFQAKYGWKPSEWTDGGARPKLTEDILSALPYPEAAPLAELQMLKQRIGQLALGAKAFLKVERGGRIHGRVHATGARTGRMSHSDPNVNVPKVRKDKVTNEVLLGDKGGYGAEFRALFCADKGHALVGVDASGLEMRMLGHYLAKWDEGRFAEEVTDGDVHTYMMQVTGIKNRETQKTWTYARLYGAGDPKLGKIMGVSPKEAGRVKDRVTKVMPGMTKLEQGLDAAKKRGYVIMPDGRRAATLSRHDTLNTLLQGSGSVVLKVALVIADCLMQDRGLLPCEEVFDGLGDETFLGVGDYEFVLNVHDEWQITCRSGETEAIVQHCAMEGMRLAGVVLGLRVAIAAEAKIGTNWKETH